MKRFKNPKITLVGAGPGDPDLLTLKAIKILEEADVVLYDALVSQPILNKIKQGTPAFSVGKRGGKPSMQQETINALMVRYALEYGHVVRLKGGDPFVFGRGFEECLSAREAGIQVEVIPGISSALGISTALQLPLTHRGISESFWVVAGATQSGKISEDLRLAAKSTATVVVLMGLNRVGAIMSVFREMGKPEMGVMAIQKGTLPDQKWVSGTVENIEQKIQEQAIDAPAILVIGRVVELFEATLVVPWIENLTFQVPV